MEKDFKNDLEQRSWSVPQTDHLSLAVDFGIK